MHSAQGKCNPVVMKAGKVWPQVNSKELFISFNMEQLEQFR